MIKGSTSDTMESKWNSEGFMLECEEEGTRRKGRGRVRGLVRNSGWRKSKKEC